MKTILTALAGALLLGAIPAQASMQARLERKLGSPFLDKAAWETDYDAALARAKRERRVVFCYLTRSYAYCPFCLECERGPLSSPAFAKFAKRCVPLCHITSRVPGAKDQGLLTRVGGRGFPYIVFLDARGRVLATPDERSVASFAATLSIIERMQASLEAAGRSEAARVEVEICKVQLGQTNNPLVAQTRIEEAGKPTAEQLPRIARLLDELRVAYWMRRGKRKQRAARIGAKLAAMFDKGHIPTRRDRRSFFWRKLAAWAKLKDDHVLIKRAQRELTQLASGTRGASVKGQGVDRR